MPYTSPDMSWLERLDASAVTWSKPARFAYFGAKWYLIALGGFALVRLTLDRTGIWPLY